MTNLAYLRCSTEEQATSGAGIEAQRAVLERYASPDGEPITRFYADEGFSGASMRRPALGEALAQLRPGDRLICSRLDRLSRSVADLTTLAATATRQAWHLVALDVGIDTSTASGMFVFHTLAAVSELERGLISERTSAALAAKQRSGVRLGAPRIVGPSVRRRITDLRAGGLSWRLVALTLDDEGVPTARGGRWQTSSVRRMAIR